MDGIKESYTLTKKRFSFKRSYCAATLSLGLLAGACMVPYAYADEEIGRDASTSNEASLNQPQTEKAALSVSVAADKLAREETQKQSLKQGVWKRNARGWWYEFSNGSYYKDGLFVVDDVSYHFDHSGYMSTGWVFIKNNWYYFNPNGSMAVGWVKDRGIWYYLNAQGIMQTGWLKDKGTWYYLNASGAMQIGWLKDGDTWYYLSQNGSMQTGWIKLSNTWYYLNASGAMQTGWLNSAGTWYYLASSGAMQTGWIKDGSIWYYLYDDGAMARNTWIGKYYLDSSGAWTQTRKHEQRVNVRYYQVGASLNRLAEIEKKYNPYIKGGNVLGKILSGLNPDNFTYGSRDYYQFADLTKPAHLSAQDLNNFIASTPAGRKGVFMGKGQVFIDAARKYHINEAYLLAHAILESGWGNSTLAQGYDFDTNEGYVVNGHTYVAEGAAPSGRYYNFFGIGAVDKDPLNGGRRYAIQNGWRGIDGGIEGAAQWISDYYIYSRSYHQNTLYKMRWNAEKNAQRGETVHQYATDPLWAKKIGNLLGSIYDQAQSNPTTYYLVPEYQ